MRLIQQGTPTPDELLKSVYITLPKKARATEYADHKTASLMHHELKEFLKKWYKK